MSRRGRRVVSRFLARQLREARNRWRRGLSEGRGWLTLPVTAITMYVLWHWAFGLGPAFGFSFLIAASLAIVRGHIFTHPLRLVLVAVAVVIGTLVIPSLGGDDALQAFRRGDTAAAMILGGAVVLAWLLKRRLETGRRVVGVGARGRRRRPRRR